MAISYKDIRTERQWKASTGLSEEQFNKLVPLFEQAYVELFDETIDERQSNSPSDSAYNYDAGSSYFLVNQDESSTLIFNSSNPALPYICLLIFFNLLTCPSTCPLLQS